MTASSGPRDRADTHLDQRDLSIAVERAESLINVANQEVRSGIRLLIRLAGDVRPLLDTLAAAEAKVGEQARQIERLTECVLMRDKELRAFERVSNAAVARAEDAEAKVEAAEARAEQLERELRRYRGCVNCGSLDHSACWHTVAAAGPVPETPQERPTRYPDHSRARAARTEPETPQPEETT